MPTTVQPRRTFLLLRLPRNTKDGVISQVWGDPKRVQLSVWRKAATKSERCAWAMSFASPVHTDDVIERSGRSLESIARSLDILAAKTDWEHEAGMFGLGGSARNWEDALEQARKACERVGLKLHVYTTEREQAEQRVIATAQQPGFDCIG
jgi:hypothetical protein